MSIEAMSWALGVTVGDTTQKFVLACYANHAHKDGRHSWPSHATVAEYVECSQKTVGRAVKKLVADGWMRVGDQTQVAHLRADRRPVVYDLAMSETTRLAWKTEHSSTDSDGWTPCPPVPVERPDTVSTRSDATGGHTGGHSRPHGGTPVSYKPSGTEEHPPTPQTHRCRRHRDAPVDNCRACGTTTRQLAAQDARAAAEATRAAEQARLRAERDEAAAKALPSTSPKVRQILTEAGLR